MTERMSRAEYRVATGQSVALPQKPKRRTKDAKWHAELHQQILMHPELKGVALSREYKFHPKRKWLFDFAFRDALVAVEYEGLVWGGRGGHQTVEGYTKNCEKYNEAALLGWTVIRVTYAQVKDGKAIFWISEAIKTRKEQER